jgi:hypothetical protein
MGVYVKYEQSEHGFELPKLLVPLPRKSHHVSNARVLFYPRVMYDLYYFLFLVHSKKLLIKQIHVIIMNNKTFFIYWY